MTASSGVKRSSDFYLPNPKKTPKESLDLGLIPFLNCAIGLIKQGTAQELMEGRKSLILHLWCVKFHLKVTDILSDESLIKSRRLAIISKLAGHIFSWKGNIPLSSYKEIPYSSFSELLTIPFLVGCLENPSLRVGSFNKNDLNWISKVFKSCLLGDLLGNNDYVAYSKQISTEIESVFLLSSGYETHQTFIVIWNNYLLIANRGRGSEDNPGIQAFSLPDRSVLTPDTLRFMLCVRGHSEEEWPSASWIKNKLKLKLEFTIKMSAQKIGNCTWASVKASLRIALAIKKSYVNKLHDSFCITYGPYKSMIHSIKHNFTGDLATMLINSNFASQKVVVKTLLSKIPKKYHK